jgi:hypothetical protein
MTRVEGTGSSGTVLDLRDRPICDFLRRQQLLSHSRNSQQYMQPEGSITCSQEPATSVYPESHESSPHPSILFIITLMLSYHLRQGLSNDLLSSRVSTRSACPISCPPWSVHVVAISLVQRCSVMITHCDKMKSLNSSNWPNPCGRTRPLGLLIL